MNEPKTGLLQEKLENALKHLEEARPFVKVRYQSQVLEVAGRLLAAPGGPSALYSLAPRLDQAGIFLGTDWAQPATLLPRLVRNTFEHGDKATVVLEAISELRLLAVANGVYQAPDVPPEQARHFLTQLLALNLDLPFGYAGESLRVRLGSLGEAVAETLRFLLDQIGYEDMIGSLLEEIWRILGQRPIHLDQAKAMITQVSVALSERSAEVGEARFGIDRLISALYGPTQGSLSDPGLGPYGELLDTLDSTGLQQEAYGFARAMHDTGLVSDYHALFLRWLVEQDQAQLIPDALGLSTTGLDVYRSYQDLIHHLVLEAIHPQTSQAVYGLAMLLERGILYNPPIAPGLWRQIGLKLCEPANQALSAAFGEAVAPRVRLLAGVISLLGLPFGIGQGNNPTCQSVRAISMWSYNDPDYLLHLVYQAAGMDNLRMTFEGQAIVSRDLPVNLSGAPPLDTDPVSMVLVPHLDRIYGEMGRRCAERAEDPHQWINPEFHGWWVGREFRIAVEVATGLMKDYDSFLRQFYASYHPFHNGNQPLIHPQPAGIAVTDSAARFVGWHAVTIVRVALDQDNVMRVYFYNPNNDSGQNWGDGLVVSTNGKGERFGEASLPFEQLASRLYIFHDAPGDERPAQEVPIEAVQEAKELALRSWAQDRQPATEA